MDTILQTSRPRIIYYTWSYGWSGSSKYLGQLASGVDPERYDLKLLFYEQPDPQFWDLGDSHYPHGDRAIRHRDAESGQVIEPVAGPQGASPRRAWRSLAPQSARFAAGSVGEVRRLVRFFRRYPADLIHIFDAEGATAPIAARLAGYPHVVAHYGTLPDSLLGSIRRARKAQARLSFECLDEVIVKTTAAGRMWAEWLGVPARRFCTIPNGLDLGSYGPPADPAALRAELGLRDSDLVVGISARLEDMKGHRYLIEAAARVRGAVPNVVFLVAGDGPLRGALEEQARRLGLDGVVRFLGYRSDIVPLTWLYDVATLPSTSETFGWAAAEAMACRKPVVGSGLPPIAEVVQDGETGILAPPRDAEALAAALVKLLQDPALRERMGEAGRRRVEREFTLERMRQETYALYDRHLAAPARGAGSGSPALGAWLSRIGRAGLNRGGRGHD